MAMNGNFSKAMESALTAAAPSPRKTEHTHRGPAAGTRTAKGGASKPGMPPIPPSYAQPAAVAIPAGVGGDTAQVPRVIE